MMKGIFTKTLAAFLAVGFVLSVGGCGDSSSQVSSGTVKSDYTLPDVELENTTLKFYAPRRMSCFGIFTAAPSNSST